MPDWVIIVAIVVFIIDCIIAVEFQEIAKEKGYYKGKYGIFCFLFGLPGWLMVIALPDRGTGNNSARQSDEDEIPDL